MKPPANRGPTNQFAVMDWALFTGVALVWGSTFLFIGIGIDHFAPGVVAFGRLAFGVAALAAIPGARTPVSRSAWPGIAVLGLAWMAIPWTLLPIAQQWIDSSLAGMLNGAAPLFTAIVAALIVRRRLGRRMILGLLVGFLGVVIVTLPSIDGARSSTLGVALVLVATLLYGISFNLTGPLQERSGVLPVIWRAQIVAAAATAPVALAGLRDSSFDLGSLGAVGALGILGTALAPVWFTQLVASVGSTRASVSVYFLPAVAIVLGSVFRSESIGAPALAGTALVIAGAYLASRAEVTPRPSRGHGRRRSWWTSRSSESGPTV